MRFKRELAAALAIIAAIAGAGFASGREIVAFFSGAGWASWPGIAVACASLGLFTAMLARLAQRGRAASLAGIYASAMSRECGDAVALLHSLAMLLTTSVMLAAAGELGALAIGLRLACPLAIVAALGMGLLLSSRGFQRLRLLGALLAPCLFLFYLALALDPSPAPQAFYTAPAYSVSGNAIAAVLLGALYASLNAAMSGGVLAEVCQDGISPKRLGWLTGGLLLLLLVPANAAMLRGGSAVRELALPSVVLAARWGSFGFYLTIAVMWLCVVTTLGAALGSIRGMAVEKGLNARLAITCAILASLLLGAVGFPALVQIGYPLLGWVCALCLLALIPFLGEEAP